MAQFVTPCHAQYKSTAILCFWWFLHQRSFFIFCHCSVFIIPQFNQDVMIAKRVPGSGLAIISGLFFNKANSLLDKLSTIIISNYWMLQLSLQVPYYHNGFKRNTTFYFPRTDIKVCSFFPVAPLVSIIKSRWIKIVFLSGEETIY